MFTNLQKRLSPARDVFGAGISHCRKQDLVSKKPRPNRTRLFECEHSRKHFDQKFQGHFLDGHHRINKIIHQGEGKNGDNEAMDFGLGFDSWIGLIFLRYGRGPGNSQNRDGGSFKRAGRSLGIGLEENRDL